MALEVIEGAALVVVSLVWYWSILRVVRSGRATPLRPAFITVLCAGHLMGMSVKLGEVATTGTMDPLFWLHGFNLLVVFVDFQLTAYYVRGRHSLRDTLPGASAPVGSRAAVGSA